MIESRREYQEFLFEEFLLAAWLHDIGKFYQRAGFKLDKPKDEEAMTMFARKHGEGAQARYSYLHAIFSDKFFREYLPAYDKSGTLTAVHHSPENANTDRMRYLAKMITLADWMSSGERRERESEEDTEGYQAEPLISIFSRLNLEGEKEEAKQFPSYVPLVALEASLENIFPVESKKKAFIEGDGQKSYRALWERFIADVEKLDKRFLLEQIPFLLEKFTLNIPSSTIDKPDISLYHHLKSTAAIASCLYMLQLEEKELDLIFNEIRNWLQPLNISIEEREKSLKQKAGAFPNLIKRDFLLVGGDISGIQDFIYSVTSEKALKGLKGRSFYLQLICEAVGLLILEEFELTQANLLYSGGGHFYLLIPNKEGAEKKLEIIRQRIDEILLQAHKGKLALIVDWVPLTYADFFINFVSPWANLATKLGELKKKKFSSLFASANLEAYWPKIMGPFDIGGERRACEICSEELERSEDESCSLCQSFVSLSDELKRGKAIKLEKTTPQPLPELISTLKWDDVLKALGFHCHFWKEKKEEDEVKKEEEANKEQRYLRRYLILNSTDFAGQYDGYKFIATKITGPTGETLTLEDMAREAEGIEKWGVLRADVDGLGEVFRNGLGEDKTISRMCMLSSMLSLYFSARLNHLDILKEQIYGEESLTNEVRPLPYSHSFGFNDESNSLNYVYIAYSGGDDLFLIGPWSVLPNLAIRLHDDFHYFTSKKLTLSAGIYLAPTQKFPIYQAALDAGEAEDEAKRAGRNRIAFLGKPMTWEKLKEVREIAYKIRDLLMGQVGEKDQIDKQLRNLEGGVKSKRNAVPRSLLSIFYDAYQDKELKQKNEIPMERIWRLFYAFKKIMARFKKEDEELKELSWLLEKAIIDYEIYPELNIAARWAEYLTRKEKT